MAMFTASKLLFLYEISFHNVGDHGYPYFPAVSYFLNFYHTLYHPFTHTF